MRLSPIIRKILRPFLSRFFTKTLATATCSFTAAVFSFALLPSAHAAEAHARGPEQKLEVLDELAANEGAPASKWKDILDDIGSNTGFNFDTTRNIIVNKDGSYTFGEHAKYDNGQEKETTSIYYVWDPDEKNDYSFKLCRTEGDADANNTKKEITSDIFTISFQSNFYHGIKSDAPQDPTKTKTYYDFYHGGRGNTRLFDNANRPSDIKSNFSEKVIMAYGGPSRISSVDNWRSTPLTKEQTKGEDPVVHNKDGKNQSKTFDYYYEAGTSSNRGIAGGALFIAKEQFNDGNAKGTDTDKIAPTDSSTWKFGAIDAAFINNGLTNTDDSNANPHGGAIYAGLGTAIESIKGNFIGNYIKDEKSKSYGGAIYNMGEIGDIEANFIVNYVQASGGYAANAGAICNGKETKDENPTGGKINSLKGYFIGNYVAHTAADRDTLGGAIINYGQIGKLDGVFIGNYNSSHKTANSGVIRNYAQKYHMATIGDTLRDEHGNIVESKINRTTTVFNGIFIGNYSRGESGDAFAGVMRNNGDVNGTIEGLYVGNYAMTEGTEVKSFDSYDVGAYNYLKTGEVDEQGNQHYVRGDSGMAYGGVFYNDIKTDITDASEKPYIGDIKATFIDNYARSNYGEAFGGAIFNQNAKINNIDSDFQGNYAVTQYFRARGGALYNDSSTYSDYLGEIGSIGSEDDGKGNRRYAIFKENYAQGKMSQGGAIYVSRESKIANIYAYFSENYTKSLVQDNETKYYYDIRQNQKSEEMSIEAFTLRPTAQGGVLYVADFGQTENIFGAFENNYAETNGVGYLESEEEIFEDAEGNQVWYKEIEHDDGTEPTKGYVDSEGKFLDDEKQAGVHQVRMSMNGIETSQGGAIYVSKAQDKGLNIKNIEASFSGNYVINAGKNESRDGELYKNVSAVAQGGAIYVSNYGRVSDIVGDFKENHALGDSTGSSEELVEGGAIYVSAGGVINNIGGLEDDQTLEMEVIPVVFKSNTAEAKGQGTALTKQEVRGGAIYVSSGEVDVEMDVDGKVETVPTTVSGSISNIYADFKGNKVSINADGTTTALATRYAQGGAIYVANEAYIGNIAMANGDFDDNHGFDDNHITVEGGADGNGAKLYAQGGALYVADGGHTENIQAHFTNNSVTSESTGNEEERVGGGAIFVNTKGYIGQIGGVKDDGEVANIRDEEAAVNISNNSISALGHGKALKEQWARGGAIFVSSAPDSDNDGYSIKDINANISDNQIKITADTTIDIAAGEHIDGLQQRYARGGAIYLETNGKIGKITQGAESLNADGHDTAGFYNNSITVSGGLGSNSTKLFAQGGAFYASSGATVDSLDANFINNSITTTTADGNLEERAGGGAIYIDAKAVIGYDEELNPIKDAKGNPDKLAGIGSKGQEVTISGNSITVGGKGDNLTKQFARGGAIFVGALEDENGTAQEGEVGKLNTIYASITGNKIISYADENTTQLQERIARGGAIFLADGGKIGYIFAGKDAQGLEDNSITVSGGSEEGKAILRAGGGAMFVARSGGAKGILSGFKGNYVDTSNATGNIEEYVRGGAIFLDQGGTLESIGTETERVEISNNSLTVSGNGNYLAKQLAQGGAIYASGSNNTGNNTNNIDVIGGIYADVINNTITATAGDSTTLTTRELQGGAIYLADYGYINEILQNKKGFVGNKITVDKKVVAETEHVYGGAIYVADHGNIDEIIADFTGNTIENTGADANATEGPNGLSSNRHAKGGAIYLSVNGRIGKIGNDNTMYTENQAKGSGEVRAGAIFVSTAEVDEIHGTFLRNSAINVANDKDAALLTFGGAMRFDQSTIIRLDSSFIQNYTTGSGGALSLTGDGIIYEVRGDFIGNTAKVNGGAVDDIGEIGQRGYLVDADGKPASYETAEQVKTKNDQDNWIMRLAVQRDSTDTIEGERLGAHYFNKQKRGEYDGSFTGGFINCNFLYNTINRNNSPLTNANEENLYWRGAGIYTDKDLFITVKDGAEVIMSGNQIKKDGEVGTRSAIYVDNMNYAPDPDDYASIVVYLVAQDSSILRIDDNIRGHEGTQNDTGFVLRLRGYTDKVANSDPMAYHDKSGLIVLNNRVENSYTVMDDVTLYIGYKPRTFNDEAYFKKYGKDSSGNEITSYTDVLVGDEDLQDIVNPNLGKSTYLDVAGKTSRDSKEFNRSEDHHQSDIFRDSHMSVRSGTVALTENTYGTRSARNNPSQGSYSYMEKDEAYTEYLFGGLIAYGADYNYGLYGTLSDDVKNIYTQNGTGSSLVDDTYEGHDYHRGSDEGLYATFEFGMSFDKKNVYDMAPNGKFYYTDMNGNYTEKSSWTDLATGQNHSYELTDVPVNRKMAKSDVLTVFAQWDDTTGTVNWSRASKGRVTLNGITVKSAMNGWEYTKKAVAGDQQWGNSFPTTDEAGNVLNANHYNRDLYVQLINYMLVDANRNPITDSAKLEEFHALFDETKDDADEDTNSGYHLLRLSDHFDLVHDAKAYMKGSDILADEIELATTVTKDDTVHIVNWRDHLAEWAEHEGSATTDDQGNLQETAGLYDGKKHFLLDQSVYYLNRNINLLPNPENGDDTTGKEMWGKYLTVEGAAKWRTLDLQKMNMLSLIIEDQQVRLQSFSLSHVQGYGDTLKEKKNNPGFIQNNGDLIFDTMTMLDAAPEKPEEGLTVNNAGNDTTADQLKNQLTITGVMDIDFTITSKVEKEGADGKKTLEHDHDKHGSLIFNHSTQVTKDAAHEQQSDVAAQAESTLLSESIVHILGPVEHQDITHDGDDKLKLHSETKDYNDTHEEEPQSLLTWSIETGEKNADDVRETFTTNTYLDTTGSDKVTATSQFNAFRDNSLTMTGGAFNLGTMFKHRLQLRYFNVNGGAVFVDKSTIDLRNEVMGGIDACDANTDHSNYAGNDTIIKHDNGTDKGLIWLQKFEIVDAPEDKNKTIIHVKFVDDGVGDAVKDGMGIANGAAKSGMRIMADGKGMYNWEVTYNDPEAESKEGYAQGQVGVRGMYTFRRRGFTDEAQIASVTEVAGSFMSMMQVYNYAFQHADMFADSVYDAQREQLYERSYTVVNATKGKNAVASSSTAARPCTDKNSLKSGLWFNTFASAEKMPLHNGPDVRMDMYGGFVGGDTSLTQHRSGWASAWSFYGGYIGSTQRYDGVRIRQNGAAVGGTGTFYKKNFYTALTASVGTAQASATGRGGAEDFNLYMGGIASRSGYNFTLGGGRYVLQPSLLLSFSLFDSSDYTNAYGSKVDTRVSSVFQVNPSVKLIRKTDCAWKPYATVGFVYNCFSDTKYKLNGTELPSMSIDPYVEYSLGVQRSLGENYTIFGQATGRNGGRNGGELNFGLRRAW